MFSPTTNSRMPARADWRETVRRAVDRAVALVTLDAYGFDVPHAAVDLPRGDCGPREAHSFPRRPAPAPTGQICTSLGEARTRRPQQSRSPRGLSTVRRTHS